MDTDKGLAQVRPSSLVERRTPVPPGYTEFFRSSDRELRRIARYVGASWHEARDAASAALTEVLLRWDELDDRLAYAKRAVVSNFIKEKTRNLDRVRQRMAQHGMARAEGSADLGMTFWEDSQWVTQMLRSLPAGQREVMALVVDGFRPTEIAVLLGRTPQAVRQSLHAARQRLKQRYRQEQADTCGHGDPVGPVGKEEDR